MKKRTIIVTVIAIMMCANLTSCSSNNNKTKEGQKALDAAVKEAKKQMLERINSKEKIINQKTLKFYSNGSKIIVDIFFSVYEEIGEKRIIEMGEVDDRENIN